MALISSSNLSNWYTRLNAIRNKNGINLGDETVETVSSNDIVNLDSIETLQNKINALKSNVYLNYAQYTLSDLSNIDDNTIISNDIYENIDDTLTSLEGICAKNSTCSTTSNNTTNQSYRTNTNSTYDNCSDCITFSGGAMSEGLNTCRTLGSTNGTNATLSASCVTNGTCSTDDNCTDCSTNSTRSTYSQSNKTTSNITNSTYSVTNN